MLYRTHLAGGLLSGVVVLHLAGDQPYWTAAVVLASAAVGGLVADLDHGRSFANHALERGASKAGETVPFLGSLVAWAGAGAVRTANRGFARVVKHRGPLHSPLTALLLLVFLLGLHPVPSGASLTAVLLGGGIVSLAKVGFLAGHFSHLAADLLTDNGIRLWPLRYRLRIPLMTTGSTFERYIFGPALWLGLWAFAAQAAWTAAIRVFG